MMCEVDDRFCFATATLILTVADENCKKSHFSAQNKNRQWRHKFVRNPCGYKTTPSDFYYVISGLNGEPKSASFFAF